jgi:hypothetical protein
MVIIRHNFETMVNFKTKSHSQYHLPSSEKGSCHICVCWGFASFAWLWLDIICVTYAYGYVQFVEIKISSFSHSWLNKGNRTGTIGVYVNQQSSEKFEGTQYLIISYKSEKDRQYNDPMKEEQNTKRYTETKDWAWSYHL